MFVDNTRPSAAAPIRQTSTDTVGRCPHASPRSKVGRGMQQDFPGPLATCPKQRHMTHLSHMSSPKSFPPPLVTC
jgi:hypothetical protein